MNKKIVYVLLVVAAILSIACKKAPDPVPPGYDIQYGKLSSNDRYVATYYAWRCNQGVCWDDSGTYTGFEYILPGSVRVGLGSLRSGGSYLVLKSKTGYSWNYYEDTFFKTGGFYLEKD